MRTEDEIKRRLAALLESIKKLDPLGDVRMDVMRNMALVGGIRELEWVLEIRE